MSSTSTASTPGLEESVLRDHIRVLLRHWPIVLVTAVLVPAAAFGFSLHSEKLFTATSKLLFRDPQFDQKLFGSSILAPSQDPAREAATDIDLVSSDVIFSRASRALGGVRTPDQIGDEVDVSSPGQANVATIAVTDPDPGIAARLANAVGEQYIEFRRDADRGKIAEAITQVKQQIKALSPADRNGPVGQSVRTRITQLQIMGSLQTGNAELFQPAERPRHASSPKVARNTLVGLLVGLVLAAGLAELRERLDPRLRHRKEAEILLGRPALGAIPESRALRRTGGDAHGLVGPEADAFRKLRANLRYFDVDERIRSLLVTSASPGEGKSTIARCLAMTAAAANERVVLIDADLRRATIHGEFAQARSPGLSDVLSGRVSIADATRRLSLNGSAGDGGPTVDVITAGSVAPNPTDLLESARMGELLGQLEEAYDLVVIDTSPVTVVPDAIPVMLRVSGVLIIVREGKTTRTAVRDLREQFDNLNVVPLGVVINGSATRARYEYYTYTTADGEKPDLGSLNGSGGGRPRWREGVRSLVRDVQARTSAGDSDS